MSPSTALATDRSWTIWLGSALIVAFGIYALVTSPTPRYGLCLIAVGLSQAARALDDYTGSVRLGRWANVLLGFAAGMVVAGFLD